MTDTEALERVDVDAAEPRARDGLGSPGAPPGAGPDAEAEAAAEDVVATGPVLRPLAVAALAAGAAGLITGGIFGSWPARLLALAGAIFGVAWSYLSLRARRRVVAQLAIVPAATLLGALSLIPSNEGPAEMFSLIGEALRSGRLLRPPVPFDPGWRPVLIVVMALVGLAGGWVAVALRRPQLALVLPLPVLMLTAISQPAEGEFIAGLLGFLPILLALGLLFGGDNRVSELGAAFELKRATRAAPLPILGLVLLVLLSRTDFLFPKPVYNPAEKPQKPKAIPLGEVRDRVLFEIEGDLTGPWKTGVLDFYDGKSWRLPPFRADRLEEIPGDGIVDKSRIGDKTVKFTTADLGTSSVLPGVSGPTTVVVKSGADGDVVFDPRAGVVRQSAGRVPRGMVYEMSLPTYPSADQLRVVGPVVAKIDKDLTYIPKPTAVVQRLLDQAPSNPWLRLEFVRKKLNDVVIAAGAGAPNKAVPPSKVDELLEGNHEGTPFEIVAAEAMLARWAGIPSRIGYGFDGVLEEGGKKVVRPKLGSNWLEVYFEGYGWIPLIGAPPRAKTSLDTDPNARFDPRIVPSEDVAVELYIPTELQNLRELYERIRQWLFRALPFLVGAIATYLALPSIYRGLRRRRRRRWAAAQGSREQIAVEYCEFRDAASDLNVGDPYDTPLEFLDRVVDDDEHSELAWLVTRSTYGDLVRTGVGEEDVASAQAHSASLRRRMSRAQPLQSRVLAALSRASLREPYCREVPNIRMVKLRPTIDRTKITAIAARAAALGRRR